MSELELAQVEEKKVEVDQLAVVVNTDVLNEDPMVMDFMALSSEDLSNPSSDKGVIRTRSLTEAESKTVATSKRAGGTGNIEIIVDNNEDVCFVPSDAELRVNYTVDNFWAFPKYGAAGMLKRVQISASGTKKTMIEEVTDYNRVVEPLRDIFMSNSYVNQHLKPIEGAHWQDPVEENLGNITVAAAAVTTANAHGFTDADVGAIIAVRKGGVDRFCRITGITSGTVLAVETTQISNGIVASASSAGTIRYYPAQSIRDGKTSLVASQMQERAMGWAVSNRPAEMYHSLYGTAYLSGSQVRYLMLTQGLRLVFELTTHREALFTPFADVAASAPKYYVSGLWYQMEQLELDKEVHQDIKTKLQEMAMDKTQYGPFLHLDCHYVLSERLASGVTKQTPVWNQTYTNVDNFTVWRQPVDATENYDTPTNAHVSEEFERLETKYVKKNWEMIRRDTHGSYLSLFNQLYKETELGQSAQIDTMNLEEFKNKPYVVVNLQRLRVSDNYTGLETSDVDKFQLQMKYYDGGAPTVDYNVIWVGQYKRRVVIDYDENSGFIVQTVRD